MIETTPAHFSMARESPGVWHAVERLRENGYVVMRASPTQHLVKYGAAQWLLDAKQLKEFARGLRPAQKQA